MHYLKNIMRIGEIHHLVYLHMDRMHNAFYTHNLCISELHKIGMNKYNIYTQTSKYK